MIGIIVIAGAAASPEMQWTLAGPLEDACRISVLALAGLTIGLLILIGDQMSRLKIDKTDSFFWPLTGVAISYILLLIFAAIELGSRIKVPYMTWRTPLGAAIFITSVVSLTTLLRRVSRIVRQAQKTDATVKMTMTDTSKPGPDTDLVTGTTVIKTDNEVPPSLP